MNLPEKVFGLVVALAGMVRIAILYANTDENLVKHIPDDAFYYLVPARNFAVFHRWTFDGFEPASGFHLLWGYLLAGLFKLFPNASLHFVFAIGSTFQVGCLALAAYLLAVTARRLFGAGAIPGLAIVFFSAALLQQSGWLMESSLVIAASAAVLFLLAREDIRLSGQVCLAAFLVGLLLMLSRSDAGLLSFLLLLALWFLGRKNTVCRAMPKLAAVVFAGSVCGLALTFLHTHWVSGQWLQSSAQQKLYWSHLAGRTPSIVTPFFESVSFFDPLLNDRIPFIVDRWSSRPVAIVDAALRISLLLALAWGVLRTMRSGASRLARGILLSMILVTFAYYLIYSQDGAIQGWYIANFAAPVALLAASASVFYTKHYRAPLYGVVLSSAILGFIFSLQATLPWQSVMCRAGRYLHEHPEIQHVGSFNAGIIGFYSRDNLTNLDGLVNDSILPYAKQGKLAQYMGNRGVSYIMDWPAMLYSPGLQLQGGHTDGKLLGCLQSADDLFPEDRDNIWAGGHLTLYKFSPACLRRI